MKTKVDSKIEMAKDSRLTISKVPSFCSSLLYLCRVMIEKGEYLEGMKRLIGTREKDFAEGIFTGLFRRYLDSDELSFSEKMEFVLRFRREIRSDVSELKYIGVRADKRFMLSHLGEKLEDIILEKGK